MGAGAAFYTIADATFFPGTVALLNSLRLTRNDEELVVLDMGLAEAQRRLLESHARVVDLPREVAANPYVSKPYPHLLGATGEVALIDSDIIVTRSLAPVFEHACEGKICLFPDHHEARGRWFAEWQDAFGLAAPPRRQPYLNAGFVALRVECFPGFLERFWQACSRIPVNRHLSRDHDQPFWAGDQDALNALLMSEIPPEAIEVLAEDEVVFWDALGDVEVLDAKRLSLDRNGTEPLMLHYSFRPKPWEPRGWIRAKDDAFLRLLPRLLFGDDVPLRLTPTDLPFWIRPGRGPRAALRALDLAHRAAKAAINAPPEPVRRKMLALRDELMRRAR